MKKRDKNTKRKRILPIILLAVLCLGGAELVACRVADPALYARITAPVRDWAETARNRGQNIIDTLSEHFTQDTKEADNLEKQLAGNPAILQENYPTDPIITKLTERDGKAVLTGGFAEIVYYNQGDSDWAQQPYGKDTLDQYGCGPTAMAMAISSIAKQDVNPAEMARWAYQHGYWASRSGSYLSIVEGTAKAYGLSVESFRSSDPDELRQAISSGRLGVALMSSGHFTQGGHFILLRGVTLDGDILVADPNSIERSLTTWDAQLILDELSDSRQNGAPLWLLHRESE